MGGKQSKSEDSNNKETMSMSSASTTTTTTTTTTPTVPYPIKEFPFVPLPKDSDGFAVSFSVDDEAGFKKFFDEYGFVVVDGVLSEEECNASIEEIWQELEGEEWGWTGSPKVSNCLLVCLLVCLFVVCC